MVEVVWGIYKHFIDVGVGFRDRLRDWFGSDRLGRTDSRYDSKRNFSSVSLHMLVSVSEGTPHFGEVGLFQIRACHAGASQRLLKERENSVINKLAPH